MEEISAFAIYKKSTPKKSAKKQSPNKVKKLRNKKQVSEAQVKRPAKSSPNVENGNTEEGLNKVKQVKPKHRTKNSVKKQEKPVEVVQTTLSIDNPTPAENPNEIPAKSSSISRKRKQNTGGKVPANENVAKPTKKVKQSSKEQLEVRAEETPKPQENVNKIVKQETLSPSTYLPIRSNSTKDGSKLLKWLLAPIGVDAFFENFWERAPCLVERNDPAYFSKLISFEMIDQMLIDNHIEFTKNIDITSYKNGERETLNPEGRAMPSVVWDHYSDGCSIRLLNPQTYLPAIFTMNTTLQEFFHCMVGSNSYLTPPNSQGFAPHYDDIEAFVLQIEGRKRWKLYNPRSKKEELPRFSSKNFSQGEIGEPILEKVLLPGDILYFPRGTIHQAFTEPGYHSLHITLSVYQKQSYADLMEKMFPLILQRAIAENVDFRRGLPLNVWQNAGIVFSDVDTRERQDFLCKCRDLIAKAFKEIPVDQAVDQLAKKFQHEALPPEITLHERSRTVFGSKNIVDSQGQCVADYEIDSMSKVRLLRANIMRLVEEEDKVRIYYYVDNSKEYCEYEPNYIEIEPDDASSVDVLIKSYPEYVAVNELPLDDEERKISIVQTLWERGLLMFDKPFNA